MKTRVYHHTQHGMAVASKYSGGKHVFVNFAVSYIHWQRFKTWKAADGFLRELGYTENKESRTNHA